MVKDGYKKTEAGTIPDEWQTDTFQECFDTLPNNTLSRAELNYNGGTVKNIHYGDVLIKFPAVTDCQKEKIPYVNRDCVSKLGTVVLHDKDVIIADTAEDETVGKATELINVGDQRIVSGLHTIPCRPKQPEQFAPKWLGYFINHRSYHNQLLPLITGTKVSSVSKSAIADTVIVIPERNEQERIVNALSDIDELIINLEQLISKKKDIRRGTIQEYITGNKRLPGFEGDWIYKLIGDMTHVSSGGTPSTQVREFWGGDIPWMNSGEVNKKFVYSVQGRITKKGLESSSAHMIPIKCVLIGLAGQGKTRGTAAINFVPLCTNQSIGAIYPSEEFDSLFLYYLMDSKYAELRELSSGDGGRGGLTKALLESVEVYIPTDVKEQEAVSNFIFDMDSEIASLENKLHKYKQIKSGMMDELLTGNVRLS